jgi:uncharacterized membrane protein
MRDLINDHAGAAVMTAVVYLGLAFFLWRRQKQKLLPTGSWTAGHALAICLLLYTGYLGGGLVFEHGVGVSAARTPE